MITVTPLAIFIGPTLTALYPAVIAKLAVRLVLLNVATGTAVTGTTF